VFVELVEHPLAFDEMHRDVAGVGDAGRTRPFTSTHGCAQEVQFPGGPEGAGCAPRRRRGLPGPAPLPGQARDVGNVLGAGPAPALLVATDHEGADGSPPANEKAPTPLGA